MMDAYYLLKFVLVLVAVSLPLLLETIKGKSLDGDFKLTDLSKILSIVLAYYVILILYYDVLAFDKYSFPFYVLIKIALTIALIVAVIMFSPLLKSIKHLLQFPKFGWHSKYYVMILTFFIFTILEVFVVVELSPKGAAAHLSNLIVLKAINKQPITATAILMLTEIFGIAGEELVCRYFAINALRQILKDKSVIVLSAVIFTLTHWNFGIGTIILGILLGYLYLRTGSLSICILLHFIGNLTILTIPFYVFYRELGDITISPIQYVLALFVFQVILYHSTGMLFIRTSKKR